MGPISDALVGILLRKLAKLAEYDRDCSTPVKRCGPVGIEPLFAWAKDAPGWKLPDNFKTEAACMWNKNYTVPIIAYYAHTHRLGSAVTGWIHRNGKWIEIGRIDTHYPEVVIDVTAKGMHLMPGDIVASKCTFDNPKNRKVYFWYGHDAEMCDLYINYGFPHDVSNDKRIVIGSNSAQSYHWEDQFDTIPSKASDPTGDTDQALYIKRFNMKKQIY